MAFKSALFFSKLQYGILLSIENVFLVFNHANNIILFRKERVEKQRFLDMKKREIGVMR